MLQGGEVCGVVHRVSAKSEHIRGLQSDGSTEVADGYCNGVAIVAIAGIAQKPYSRIRFTLDTLASVLHLLDMQITSTKPHTNCSALESQQRNRATGIPALSPSS